MSKYNCHIMPIPKYAQKVCKSTATNTQLSKSIYPFYNLFLLSFFLKWQSHECSAVVVYC